MMNPAPVILFVYNRPDHTQRTLDALAANTLAAQSDLIIYADGAPTGAKEQLLKQIDMVRQIIQSENRFKKVTIHIADTNRGLASSIIAGVTEVINKHGRAIVLEDDLLTSVHFLSFMNHALTTFENNDKVACVSGYIYPAEQLPDTFFLKGADCWGWATWKRSWDLFEENGDVLLQKLNHAGHAFDFNFYNSYPYMQMLEDQIAGKNKSWAIRWYASAYLAGKLTLYPGHSLVRNIGFDGTGIHSGRKRVLYKDFPLQEIVVGPIPVKENEEAKEKIAAYFRHTQRGNFTTGLKKKIVELLRKIQGR